jgi:hypothetical protein
MLGKQRRPFSQMSVPERASHCAPCLIYTGQMSHPGFHMNRR